MPRRARFIESPASAIESGGAPAPVFEVEITAALGDIRRSLAATLGDLGATPDTGTALARRLKLNRTLSWRLARIVSEPEPFQAIQLLPGRAAFDGLLKNLRSAGASSDNLARMRQSLDAFDTVVERHCGDRDTLDMMLSHRTGAFTPERAESLRRLSFRGNSGVWGVQVRVQTATHIIAPGSRPGLLDAATVNSLVDFRRLRPEVTWTIGHASSVFDDGTLRPGDTTRAIDDEASRVIGVPLLADFCSKPLPPVRVVPTTGAGNRFELVEGPVGMAAALTTATGWIDRNAVPRYRQEKDERGELYMSWSTPSELAILDVLFHRSLDETRNCDVCVYSKLPGGPDYPRSGLDAGKLPFHERLIELGEGPPNLIVAELPQYPKMVEHVLSRVGWDAKDFRAVRLRVRYPSIPAIAVIRYELPEAP